MRLCKVCGKPAQPVIRRGLYCVTCLRRKCRADWRKYEGPTRQVNIDALIRKHKDEVKELDMEIKKIEAVRIQSDERALRELGYDPMTVSAYVADEALEKYYKKQ